MNPKLIGRKREQEILRELLTTPESEFVAVYGRRRVGKTFLIEQVYQNELLFTVTGINQGSKQIQLENFMQALQDHFQLPFSVLNSPQSWLQAFQLLKQAIDAVEGKQKKVIFIDELPWLASSRSGFLPALENFWNAWAAKRSDIVLAVCGSAASWMISNVVRSRGGLHNRITRRIRLMPFNLHEAEAYLKSRHIHLEKYDILQLYMVMGGIPHYLKEIRKGQSAAQAIDEICFSKDGLLRDEFLSLYQGLFNNAERYIEVIKALAAKPKGLNRNELIHASKLTSGGTTTKIFESLAESGFIIKYLPFGKNTKSIIYKLSDPYSAFYLKFIANSRASGVGSWLKQAQTQKWRSWSGFAFERLCLAHINQIEQALGISGIYTEASIWQAKASENVSGAQIDLLIDRGDRVINICEIKFTESPFNLTKKYADELQAKIWAFKQHTQTRKTLFLTMITTYGLVENAHSNSLVQQKLEMEVLFKE